MTERMSNGFKMTMKRSTFSYLLVVLLLHTCFGKRNINLEAITFNADLNEFTAASNQISVTREARRDNIIAALNDTDADILCVQEAWFGEDVQAIVEGLSSVYPYSFSHIHKKDGTANGSPRPKDGGLCDLNVWTPVGLCVNTKCKLVGKLDDIPLGELIRCSLAECNSEAVAVASSSPECFTCLHASFPDAEKMSTRCFGSPGKGTTLKKMNTPGLLMLSKERLLKPTFFDFYPIPNLIWTRGLLKATLAKSRVIAACTQLSFANTEFDGQYIELNTSDIFTSYSFHNMYETFRLLDQLVTYNKRRALVLGDFMAGPAGRNGITGHNKGNYGFLSRDLTTTPARGCSVCPDNVYNKLGYNILTDHIMGNRLFIDRVKILEPTSTLYYNGTLLPLSGHKPVMARVRSRQR